MDQELKAYLEERFGRIDARFEQMDRRFEQIDARFEKVDARFEQVDARFEQVDTAIRHTHVLLEAVQSDVRLVAEGSMGAIERLETFQQETARRFDEVKAMIAPYYQTTNGEIQKVDREVKYLDRRVKLLEDRAERQTRDVFDAIRQKFGKPQA